MNTPYRNILDLFGLSTCTFLWVLMLIALGNTSSLMGQIRWDGSSRVVVDFDESIEGVISGPFAGKAVSPSPSRGELDSNFWSDSHRFGRRSDELPRGGGLFQGYESISNEYRFYAAEPGGDFGRIFAMREGNDYSNDSVFRILYTGSNTIDGIRIAFDAFTLKLDAEQMSGYRAAVSFNGGANFVRVPELDIKPAPDELINGWYHRGRKIVDLEAQIQPFAVILIQFSSHSVKGYGDGRSMSGWDNLTIEGI